MTSLLEKIRSRGYWRVIIRPCKFAQSRIPQIPTLYPLIQTNSVRAQFREFPVLDPQTHPHIDLNWVGQELEWEYIIEAWRFYQSGQFAHYSGIKDDWRDQSSFWPADQHWKSGVFLEIQDTVRRFTEIFEFASRLALTEAGDEKIHLEVMVSGLQDRILSLDSSGSSRRMTIGQMLRSSRASIKEFPYTIEVPRAELIASPKELALKPTRELFQRFGWNPEIEFLRSL